MPMKTRDRQALIHRLDSVNEGDPVNVPRKDGRTPGSVFIIAIIVAGLNMGMPTRGVSGWENTENRKRGPLSNVEEQPAETELITLTPQAAQDRKENKKELFKQKPRTEVPKKENPANVKESSARFPQEDDTSAGWVSPKEDPWENEDQTRTLWSKSKKNGSS
jgi:hypothetical protein